jgi:hypothetical protein
MGSCCTGDAPTPPNPAQTAAAQTGTNVSTAVANSQLNRVNQVTPGGSLTYANTGEFEWTDPSTGNTYKIPLQTATQTLSPEQQNLYNLNQQTQTNLGQLGSSQSAMLQNLLGHPLDTSGAPRGGDPNSLQGYDAATGYGNPNDRQLRTFDDGDGMALRQRAEEALFQRLDPQLQRDRANMEARLADQGIKLGSPAYQAAMDQFDRQLTDTRLGITEKGLAEQKAAFEQAQGRATFYNAAQQQDYTQDALRAQFGNAANAQNMSNAVTRMSAYDKARAQWLNEQTAQRQAPINEITALMSGSQVQQPNYVNVANANIPTTDYAGLVNNRFSQDMANYQQSSQNFNQIMGGIFGAVAGLTRSDRREKDVGEKLGTVFAAGPDGEKPLPIYEYQYKDDPSSTTHVGPMAQDVEKIDRSAVKTIAGTKYIDRTRIGSILRDNRGARRHA